MQVDTGYSANNKIVLKNYANKISKRVSQPIDEGFSLWKKVWPKISSYLPTTESAGKKMGEAIALAHGQDLTNGAIDFVVEKIFQHEEQQASFWKFEWFKQRAANAAKKGFGEALKLTVTPKAIPALTVFCGVTGQIALPLMVSLVSYTYKKAMVDPEAFKKLAPLTLEQLFTIDLETNRLRDAFGHLMTTEDMLDIYRITAKHALIAKLIELCNQIDENPDEANALLHVLVQTYLIHRTDDKITFPDGTSLSEEQHQIIEDGINTLARNNFTKKQNKIRCFIRTLSKHSILPLDNLSLSNIDEEGKPRKMPMVFSGDDEWKNYIIRGEDNCFVVYKDCGDKKRGDAVSVEEMREILMDVDYMQRIKGEELKAELENLFLDTSKQSILIEKLNQLDAPTVKAFLQNYVIHRKADENLVYLDGSVFEEKEKLKLLRNLDAIPSRSHLKDRSNFLKELLKQLSSHTPKDYQFQSEISCSDGQMILRDGSPAEKAEALA